MGKLKHVQGKITQITNQLYSMFCISFNLECKNTRVQRLGNSGSIGQIYRAEEAGSILRLENGQCTLGKVAIQQMNKQSQILCVPADNKHQHHLPFDFHLYSGTLLTTQCISSRKEKQSPHFRLNSWTQRLIPVSPVVRAPMHLLLK